MEPGWQEGGLGQTMGEPVPLRDRAKRALWIFVSGSLLLAAVALIAQGAALAQTDPPPSGDWVVADSTTVANTAVTVAGNVVVSNGGSLTLNAVALRITSSTPGEFGIYVRPGATLTVSGGSIGASASVNGYRFEIYGPTTIDRATVRDMWGSTAQDRFGIQIYNGNTTITNSVISNGYKGNILVMSGSPYIYNNTIELARYVESSNASSWSCQFNIFIYAFGILAENNSAPIIEGNRVRLNGIASTFSDPWQTYYDQYYASCGSTYFYLYEYLFGYGIAVRGANAEILNNSVTQNSQMPAVQESHYINGTNVYSQRYSEQVDFQNNIAAGGLLLGSGKGNVTGNAIDNNGAYGIVGDGSQAAVFANNVSNHRKTSIQGLGGALFVSGGVTIRNTTFYDNVMQVVMVGTGVGILDGVTVKNVSASIGVYVYYYAQGTLSLYNMSFAGLTQAINFLSYYGATVNLYNCTISQSQMNLQNFATGQLNVIWPLQVEVVWPNGAAASLAFAVLTNQSGGVLYADLIGVDGISPYMWIAGISIRMSQGSADTVTNTPLAVKVYANGTISTPYEFAFNGTTYVRLVILDPIPPTVNVFAPLDGSRFNSSVVRVWGNAFDVGSGMDFVQASADGGLTWAPSDVPLPGWSMDLTLDDGTHDLILRAFDRSGTYTELNITGIVVDTVAPVLAVLQPALPSSGEKVAYTTFTAVILRGTVDDDAALTVNGDPLSVQGGTFSKQLILAEGPNFFHLVAVDEVGNRDLLDFVLISDTIAPAVYVSSPPDNFATNRSLLNVAGVTESDVSLTLNGARVSTTGGVFTVTYALSEGLNTLTITAVDRAGNNNTIARTVTFDTIEPDITILSPTPNLVTARADLTVSGSVEAGIATVYVNGAPVPTVRGAFLKVVRLDEGRSVITLQAFDPAGNPATASVVVTLDTVPPTLSLTAPLDGALVNTNAVQVAGTWSDAVQAAVNDVALPTEAPDFAVQVGLVEGANLIVASAVDAAGNRVEVRVRVTRDTVAPIVTVDLPATPLKTTASVATIHGRATGASELRMNGQLIALDAGGNFNVSVPLLMGENKLTFAALDEAGNTVTVLGVLNRVAEPVAPQGLFGLGDLQYALLPLLAVVGAIATYAVLRIRRGSPPA